MTLDCYRRLVVLSSRGHQLGGLDLDDLDFRRRPYDKWIAYGQAKTANSLFAVALDARGEDQDVRAFAVHPGSILGPLARHLSREEIDMFGALSEDGSPVIDPARDMKTAEQGAATTIWCATASELQGLGGVYCEDCDIAPVETERNFGVRPFAIDPDIAEALWSRSVELTGRDLQSRYHIFYMGRSADHANLRGTVRWLLFASGFLWAAAVGGVYVWVLTSGALRAKRRNRKLALQQAVDPLSTRCGHA